MFASHARQAAARQAAEQARHEAGESFVALDETQKSISMVVEAYARLDAGPAGERVRRELTPLTAAGDAASQGWIDALDAHRPHLDDADAEPRALQDAEQAFRAARSALDAARADLATFESRHRDIEQRMQAAWAEIAPRSAAAQRSLAAARAAVASVEASGVHSPDLAARLAEAEQLGAVVAAGAQRHGAAAMLQACDRAVAAADAVEESARTLLRLAADTPRRLGTTRTRLEGVAARIETLPPTLSRLRRTYSMACSSDLDHLPEEAGRAVADARRLLTEAGDRGRQGQWEAAAAALARCRERLALAESGVNQVVQRLRDLDAVAADPTQEKARARFVVRDAQTLVVAAGSRVPANEATVLDSLVVRLEEVEHRLGTGAHPDYWAYLVELRAVTDVANAVVRRVRAAMGPPR